MAADSGLNPEKRSAQKLVCYLEQMLETNRSINLTAIRSFEDALVLHALDSLHVYASIAAPRFAIDIGSGNGFPGAAVATLWPELRSIWVERTRKKAKAMEACAAAAELENVEVRHADAQQLPSLEAELRGKADLVTLRAVTDLGKGLQLARPFLRGGGLVIQWKAAEIDPEERAEAARLSRHLGFQPREDYVYVLPGKQPRPRRLVSFLG